MAKNSTPSKGETKTQIIHAAIKLFYENGAHWVSFQKIADKVQISQPAIYKHFEDKDDLMKACILNAAESGRVLIDAHVASGLNARDRLKYYIEGNLIWIYEQPAEAAMLTSMSYFALSSQAVHELMNQIYTQSVRRLAARIEEGNEEKFWKVRKTKTVARAIHDMILAEIIKGIHFKDEGSLEQRVEFLWSFISKWLPKDS